MTKQEAITELENHAWEFIDLEANYSRIEEAINMAIEALQIEISEDAISRDAAINLVNEYQRAFIYESDADELIVELETLPSVTPTEQNEEDILKFYYVESLDEYWIGQRCGTRYYGKWTGNCFTFTHSRYLPWGEHVVAPDTLWKEHTYPSEPKEIPFNEWLQGFLKKECPPVEPQRPKGEWNRLSHDTFHCILCGRTFIVMQGGDAMNYCPNCSADMKGGTENDR